MNWNYDEKDYQEMQFRPIPPGKYRVRIESVEETTSRTGKPMYKIELKVSGHNSKVWHYIVFDQENKAMVNKNLGDIFESFKIPAGNLETLYWKGKVGGAMLKQEPYNDQMTTKVSYFLSQKQQQDLPPWQEETMGDINTEMVDLNGSCPF